MVKGVLHCLSVVLMCSVTLSAGGQHLNAPSLSETFSRHVKSVDELMKRFNGEEAYPELDTAEVGFREKNLLLLMDFDMSQVQKKEAMDFIKAVNDNQVKLSYESPDWIAVATCLGKYKSKQFKVRLALRTECIRGNVYRWAICGADGVLGQIVDTLQRRAISPTEHEIHFIELQSIFHNECDDIFGYREEGRTIDPLSVFFALIHSGAAKMETVADLKFVFLEVPGYVFTIEEKARKANNSGWLITEIQRMNNAEKQQYVRKLTGDINRITK